MDMVGIQVLPNIAEQQQSIETFDPTLLEVVGTN
jgi:hypothetical protein